MGTWRWEHVAGTYFVKNPSLLAVSSVRGPASLVCPSCCLDSPEGADLRPQRGVGGADAVEMLGREEPEDADEHGEYGEHPNSCHEDTALLQRTLGIGDIGDALFQREQHKHDDQTEEESEVAEVAFGDARQADVDEQDAECEHDANDEAPSPAAVGTLERLPDEGECEDQQQDGHQHKDAAEEGLLG